MKSKLRSNPYLSIWVTYMILYGRHFSPTYRTRYDTAASRVISTWCLRIAITFIWRRTASIAVLMMVYRKSWGGMFVSLRLGYHRCLLLCRRWRWWWREIFILIALFTRPHNVILHPWSQFGTKHFASELAQFDCSLKQVGNETWCFVIYVGFSLWYFKYWWHPIVNIGRISLVIPLINCKCIERNGRQNTVTP